MQVLSPGSVNNFDFGGMKLRVDTRPSIRSPSSLGERMKPFQHGLGGLLANPEADMASILESVEFNNLASFLQSIRTESPDVASNFFVCTAPGRAAQLKEEGRFSKEIFNETGFLPWVISAHLEAKIMAYSLRSDASQYWEHLSKEPALLHIHPGSQSLEISLSSHGHASFGPHDVLGFEESLGFLATPFEGNNEGDFKRYKEDIKSRILASPHIMKVLNFVTELDSIIPQIVVSGRAFRKLHEALILERSKEKFPIIREQETNLLEQKAIKNFAFEDETIHGYKIFGLNQAQIYALAVLDAIKEIVSPEISKKGFFVSDASLVNGINELRVLGSVDHCLMPELAEDMYKEFMQTLIGNAYDKETARNIAKQLSCLVTLMGGEQERAGFNQVAALHGVSHAQYATHTASEEVSDLFAYFFGSNRFPSEPREYQEAFYYASLGKFPEDNLRTNENTERLALGMINLSRALFTGINLRTTRLGADLTSNTLKVMVGTEGELRKLQDRSRNIQAAAQQLGLSQVTFSLG